MGMGGARLSHNHERQYTYVMQSMMLWREVSNDMFKLWYLAEGDLLREGGGQLTNTGQGLNRVQSAPQTNKAIHQVLARCQAKLGHWVGSSVVHLGDHNVPNALMFIDKYTQVPADPEPRRAGGATSRGAVRRRRAATVRGEHVRGRGRVQEDHPGGLFQARLRRLRGG